MDSLPTRLWKLLADEGPSYPAALAAALSVRDSAVSTALASLSRRDLVAVYGRDGRRKLFHALGTIDDDGRPCAPEPEPEPEPQLEPGCGPLAPGAGASAVDLALLRAAHPSNDIEMLLYTNRGVRGL